MNPFLYQPVYLLIVTIFTFVICQNYTKWYGVENNVGRLSHTYYAVLLIFFMILFIGLRPISGVFVDMSNYNLDYKIFKYGKPFIFSWSTDNFLFDNLLGWLGSKRVDIVYFFFIIAGVYFGFIFWACRKMFPNDVFLAVVMYLGAFTTFSSSTNGIKAGAAAAVFLAALAYKDNLKVSIPLLWVSLGLHHSMLAPIVAFVIVFFYRTPKYFLYGWLICLLLAAFNITSFMFFFSEFTTEHGAGYLKTEQAVISGFRPDFILYSAIPIFLGYYYIQKEKIKSDTYNFLWCIYTLTNCVFLLCTYGSYINRIAYLSWLMLPFVLLYPVLYCDDDGFKLRNLHILIYGHLGFTLFMEIIYY